MFFEADPDEISRLSSTDLVQLMKLLLLAEARHADIPLRATTVPLQITIPDGGEDGRVEWSGDLDSTDYFPSNFCVFQAKAQAVTRGSIRKELLKKSKKGGGSAKPTLIPAMQDVLARKGSYIVFTSRPLTKIDTIKDAIRSAIRDAGRSPSRLSSIEVYDANKIADWANTHPSVALWLAKHARRRSVSGFQTHASWSKSRDVGTGPWIGGDSARYVGVNVPAEEGSGEPSSRRIWTFEQAADEIVKMLSKPQQVVRLSGPSGFGKSRFTFEVFNRDRGLDDRLVRSAVIYADYSIVGEETLKLALEIAESGLSTILVVDECPDSAHLKLAASTQRAESNLRLVTIDVETKVVGTKDTLAIRLGPASRELIGEIAKGVAPTLPDADARFIQDLSHGFPKMAVLAAQQNARRRDTFKSVDQLIERIIWGRCTLDPAAQRVLETLSMFDWVGISGDMVDEAETVAASLADMTADAFIEHLRAFRSRGIVIERGSFAQVQPVPLAVRLAATRWGVLADGKVLNFFTRASERLQESILRRIRWLDELPEAKVFAQALLGPSALGNLPALNSEFGSKCLDMLAHVDPDLAMSTISRVFGGLTIDELRRVGDGRRYLVWTLEKLVFRKESFIPAATLLRRLAAAETEERIGNNATGEFKQLFQLYLSGTEAEPDARLLVLDEGLASDDAAEKEVCFSALEHMLDTRQFSRSGGAEEIGSRTRLVDWRPKTYGEIWDFYRAAIRRLLPMALDDSSLFALRARDSLGSHIRGLINAIPFEDVEKFVRDIVSKNGDWTKAVQKLNEWLFFDRRKSLPETARAVRKLFDELMPTDPVKLAILYAQGWQTDFHDPDADFDANKTDYEYASRKLIELAEIVAHKPKLLKQTLLAFAASDAKSSFAFAKRIAFLVSDPVAVFRRAVAIAETADAHPNRAFFGGLIAGADSRDPDKARECICMALASERLRPDAISMIGSGNLQPADIMLVASLLRSGDVKAQQCALLSYGRGLDHLSSAHIMPLLDELSNHGSSGLWTVLDIVSMYLHDGRVPDRALANKLKNVLVASELFDSISRRTMDGYALETTIAKLHGHGFIDGVFVRKLVRQLLSICRKRKDKNVFYELDDPVRKSITRLLTEYPKEVWSETSKLLISKDWFVRHYVEDLVEPNHNDHLAAGLLAPLPRDMVSTWVRKAPKGRASIIVGWLPIANKAADGSMSWHPDITQFVNEFGAEDGVLAAVSIRLHRRTWWGSIAPHLEPLKPLLHQWTTHRNPAVRQWAEKEIQYVDREIADAIRRSDEDVVRYE